jgi:hypothetical protein
MDSTTTTPAPDLYRLDFCPPWCIGHDFTEPGIVDDAALTGRHLGVDARRGDDLYCHSGATRHHGRADVYLARADVIGNGGTRQGATRLVVSGDLGALDVAELSLDAARAIAAEIIAMVDEIEAGVEHR